MAFIKWLNGEIVNREVQAAERVSLGAFDHYQVHPRDDATMCARINADLREAGSTERIGPAPEDSNDPARYAEIRSVTYTRAIDEEGRIYWNVIPSI